MTEALTARDAIVALLESTFPELVGKVAKHKRDMVERFPSASVYLANIESEQTTSRGGVQRTMSLGVEIYRQSSNVEDVLLTNAETIERAVYAERGNIAPAVKRIHMSNTELQTDPQQKNVGTLTLTFSMQSQANLAD